VPVCPNCGVAYLDGESHACESGSIVGPRRRKLRHVAIAWTIAIVATSPLVLATGELLSPGAMAIALLAFPTGLVDLFVAGPAGGSLSRSIIGWALYVVVSLLVLASDRRLYRVLFLLLCALLMTNVAGCYWSIFV